MFPFVSLVILLIFGFSEVVTVELISFWSAAVIVACFPSVKFFFSSSGTFSC
jgi:hypothetical protein